MNEKPDYCQQTDGCDLHPEGGYITLARNGDTLRIWTKQEWIPQITDAMKATEKGCF